MGNILLIEQDFDFASILSRIFEAEGYEVTCVQTVHEALPQLRKSGSSITVMDLHDGASFCPEDIKNLRQVGKDTPILVTTNYNLIN